VFGSHSKKRPHSLTLVRCFDGRVLDMLELHLQPDSFRTLAQFKNRKCAVGLKPLVVFAGTPFEAPAASGYTLARSLLLDLFRGQEVGSVDVEGLQYLICVSSGEEGVGGGELGSPLIRVRVYLIRTRKSGQRLPRVEVEEMGPRMDFRVGRMREAEEGVMKEALRKAKGLEVWWFEVGCGWGVERGLTSAMCSRSRRRMWRRMLWVIKWGGYILGGKIWGTFRRGR